MKILVTGGAGLLGSILVPFLLKKGYKVKVLDNFYFEIDSLRGVRNTPNLEVIVADTRKFNPNVLHDVSVVIDLAAVAQPDPKQIIDPALYCDINSLAPTRVATLSKLKGIRKYIFPSTCSVYGAREEIVDESAEPNPLDSYAETKFFAESNILKLNSDSFSTTILRFPTLYGYSPKMRFDLLLNGMSLSAFQNKKIMILGNGRQRRPIVHVKDVANAIIKVIEKEESKVKGEIFNIGNNDQNFRVYEVAQIIKDIYKDCTFEFYGDPDTRSYRVNFDKAKETLNFTTEHTPQDGARELYEALSSKKLVPHESHWVIKWWAKLSKEGNVW